MAVTRIGSAGTRDRRAGCAWPAAEYINRCTSGSPLTARGVTATTAGSGRSREPSMTNVIYVRPRL
jgi:hypothetical protein